MNLDRILHDVSLTTSHCVKLRKLNSMQFLNSVVLFAVDLVYMLYALLECLIISGLYIPS